MPTDRVIDASVSIVLPVWDQPEMTRGCFEALVRYTPKEHEIVVVHLGPYELLPGWLTSSDARLVDGHDVTTFDALCARGAETASGEFVVVLHDDVVVSRRWLDGLLAPFADPGVAATAPVADGSAGDQAVEAASYRTGSDFQREAEYHRRSHRGATAETQRVDGMCLAARLSTLQGNAVSSITAGAAGRIVIAREVLVHHPRRSAFESVAHDGAARARARSTGAHETRATIAACLIVRDEVENLADCLRSVRGIADEIVVCDTGSTDGTPALAERLGARVVSFEWCDDFGAARNAALDACTAEWVLQIDADERFACENPSALRALLSEDADAVQLPILSFLSDAQVSAAASESWYERLFRRDRFRYRGRLHERLDPMGGASPSIDRSRIASFVHSGYQPTIVEAREKHERNLRIAEAAYHEGDGEQWHLAYVLGRCLGALDAHGDAAGYYEEALRELPPGRDDFRAQLLCYLAHAAIETGHPATAATYARQAARLLPGAGQPRYLLGAALNRAGRHEAARRVLTKLVTERLADTGPTVDHAAKQFHGRTELGAASRALGDHAAAASQFLTAATIDPRRFDRWGDLLDSLRRAEPDLWAIRLADAGRVAALELLAAAEVLPLDDRRTLAEALADAEWPAAALVPLIRDDVIADPDVRARWGPRLAGTVAVARLARAAEMTDPLAALELWSVSPEGVEALLGCARSLVALGHLDAAIDKVNGIDLELLDVEGLMFVAALALAAGDREAASLVLSHIDATSDPAVASEVDKLRTAIVAA